MLQWRSIDRDVCEYNFIQNILMIYIIWRSSLTCLYQRSLSRLVIYTELRAQPSFTAARRNCEGSCSFFNFCNMVSCLYGKSQHCNVIFKCQLTNIVCGGGHILQCIFGSQRTTFTLSTMQVQGIDLSLSSLVASTSFH